MARDYKDSPKIAADPAGGVKVDRSKPSPGSTETPPDAPSADSAKPDPVQEHSARHERERGEMITRQNKEMGDMHARHLAEHKAVMTRQSKELSAAGAPIESSKKPAPVEGKAMDSDKSTSAVKSTEA